jgi:hypothetical protein
MMGGGGDVSLAVVIGIFVVAAVVAWGIFSVARTAVGSDGAGVAESLAKELVENQRQLLRAQQEAAEALAELRGTTGRIEAILREVG